MKEQKILKQHIDQILQKIPDLPGCYIMFDQKLHVLYVGKAKNLKKRVRSYFQQKALEPKTKLLVSKIHDIDFFVTKTEAESLVLENNLIKKHRPRYNIRLKDDKSYPYVFVDMSESFPRIQVLRKNKLPKKKSKESLVLGPFPSSQKLHQSVQALRKIYKIRDCTNHDFHSRRTPCLLKQIYQCEAPCVGLQNSEEYRYNLVSALNFFRSHKTFQKQLIALRELMFEHAEKLEFEKAQIIKNALVDLEQFNEEGQAVELSKYENKSLDIISWFVGDDYIDIVFYFVKAGKLWGFDHVDFIRKSYLKDHIRDELMPVLYQYYDNREGRPDYLVLPEASNFKELEVLGLKVKDANNKELKRLSEMSKELASQKAHARSMGGYSPQRALESLRAILSLKETPLIVECYDIAIWQGEAPTASQVVFVEGAPDKSLYRHYHLEVREEGNNDFEMMREVLRRRLKRNDPVDVLILDGGVGQLNIALKVLADLEIDIPVASIAKSRSKKLSLKSDEITKTEERLFIPGQKEGKTLKKWPDLFKLLVQMRDEAHRFSRRLHHHQMHKRIHTWVDELRGIDPQDLIKIKENLILTRDEIKKMNIDELSRSLGVAHGVAKKVKSQVK